MIVDFNPVIISLGPLAVRWYGLMYVIGFVITGYLLKHLAEKNFLKIPKENVDNMMTTLILTMFLGARLAYVFIYNWDYYSNHMGEILAVWKGGLSFHGAIVGIMVGGVIYSKLAKISWIHLMDSLVLAGTQGVFFGRMGNFINGELYGRVTDSPFGMVFPAGGPLKRHPSQLYEGIAEGLILFLILWFVFKKTNKYGIVSSVFLIGYGSFRFLIEYCREPDSQLGYYFGGAMTMGQILCSLMIISGITLLLYMKKKSILVNNS